ncbi:MAG: arylsulfatase [Fuerstiella sp.]|nr:arylsulfatase [Fuerstiella sp.]MCP4858484.1 arylsulfatase [Fuerstiella sp.]
MVALLLFFPVVAAASKPNVVIVITDDQGYGDLSCHGNPILKTPQIDDLHSESVRLTDYHVAPTCSPTRCAFLTGHWTNRTGVWHTIMGRSMLRENEVTMGQVFKDAGYATGMFGKWHLGDNYPYRPEDRGYTEVMRHGGGGVGQTPDYWDNAYFDGSYWHNGTPEPVKGFCTDVFFDYAKRFIKASKKADKPFLAYIATNAPHGPMHAPEESAAPYASVENVGLQNFYGMIANIDDNVGRMRAFLADEGLTDNTIFIFTTDNGSSSGWRTFNAGMRAGKGSEYDGGHRVPFFVYWPEGKLTGGYDVKPITAHVDVLPTLIDLCDVAPPDGVRFDGTSIAAMLNPTNDVDWPDRILVTDSQRVKDPIKWRKSSVMTSQWRLINGKELYDIRVDAGQESDVASGHPRVVKRLTEFYDAWWEELLPSFSNDTAIYLGHPAGNPARLTSHDWITTQSTPWNQGHIRKAVNGDGHTGFWNVLVHATGDYEVRLRRWPETANLKINASLAPGAEVPGARAYRTQPGESINPTKASLRIGDVLAKADVAPDATEVVFNVTLKKGKTRMTGLFTTASGEKFGAYYAYVKKL